MRHRETFILSRFDGAWHKVEAVVTWESQSFRNENGVRVAYFDADRGPVFVDREANGEEVVRSLPVHVQFEDGSWAWHRPVRVSRVRDLRAGCFHVRERRVPGDGRDGELWDAADVARHLGWGSPRRVSEALSRGRFPAPDGRIGRSPWWRPATVREWAQDRAQADA